MSQKTKSKRKLEKYPDLTKTEMQQAAHQNSPQSSVPVVSHTFV